MGILLRTTSVFVKGSRFFAFLSIILMVVLALVAALPYLFYVLFRED